MRNPGVLGVSAVAVGCLLLGLRSPASGAGEAASADGATPPILRLDSTAAVTKFEPQTEFAMPGRPIPLGGRKTLFAGAGGMHIGVWEGGPGVLRLVNYPADEYCLMLAGVLTVTSKSGHSETFRRGDSFVIPKGFSGTWDMKERMRKQSVAFDSASR